MTVPNHDGRITSLWLQSNALSGPIPPELGDLASLESLNLHNNDLSGPIPPELGNLASLTWLSLSGYDGDGGGGNELSGPIPPELGNLASLESLLLSDNDLSGSIPPELGNLANLETLWLSENNLTGPIPPELGNLASLESLLLSDNDLSGPIPPELMNLASLETLWLRGNPDLCAPADPQLRAWLIEWGTYPFPCRSNPDVRLLPLALMRADGNGVSLPLPDDLSNPAVNVSNLGVVAATVADGWLVLEPQGIGRADVELVPSGGGSPAIAGVAVREAVGTFGIDIVMEQPAPLAYEETMVAAADWWSSVLDGTEWEDRRTGCFYDVATALADELLILAGAVPGGDFGAFASTCFWGIDDDIFNAGTGFIGVNMETPYPGDVDVIRHEIGHVLGLVLWPPQTGLTTEDEEYFIGPRAVETYRAGGGDLELPGVPRDGGHWHEQQIGCELMHPRACAVGGMVLDEPDALSLAALADAGYTVDMTKATPWRKQGNAAAAVAGEPFRERVEVRIVPRPVPE